ncbi:flavodoxin family protein [Desulfosporosinus sp. PR]|uniref:flavodoxin family protein n=1 Tax=Candidatus Desulfosporosinus nitrosoreducens TaxID=3401928 RepID=UPI0027FAA4C2|nr:flavodoxin family protein [Desulfosporosinus sp. PR]MDQ7094338.1 flavodoxin family protein [Desulfosporosinus sp. PR]
MSKVIAFLGSPRKNGVTSKLIEEVIKGAQAKGAEVKIYDLNDDRVRGCQGCFYCRSHEGCATKDYLQPMYEDIKKADGIIFGSPIYNQNISGQATLWINRMYPMVAGTRFPFQARYPGKKAVTVFSQGNEDKDAYRSTIQSLNGAFSHYGWELVDSLLCSGTRSPGFEPSDELLKQAFAAGESLTK